MKLKLKTKAAVGILCTLDMHNKTTLFDLCKKLDIPYKFGEAVVVYLKRAGWIRTVRGCKGGYLLNRDTSLIKIKDVIGVVEGLPLSDSRVVGPSEKLHIRLCHALNMLGSVADYKESQKEF